MFWHLEDARLRSHLTVTSAANADTVYIGSYVPEGKVWIVHAVGYWPSVLETQTVSFAKYANGAISYGLLNPISVAIDPAKSQVLTCIEQGMELILFPGETIYVCRGNHTAGSTMTVRAEITEIDLPLYTYDDPQTVKRQVRAMSSIRSRLGGGLGGGGLRGSIGPVDTGGRRGGPLEK